MKKVYRALVITSILLPALCLHAQAPLNGTQKEGLMQYFPAELKQVQQRYNDNTQFTTAFTNYYKSIFITDRKNYKKLVMHNKLTVGQAKTYISNLDFKYDSLHAMFSSMVAKQPSLLVQYNQKQQTRQAFTTCYPTDTNLNFTNGYLNGWNAYSEENFSTATQFIINSEVGGVCGSQELGGSTSSLDYQVAVESTLKDHLVPSIPEVPPGVK
ncbi:MAG TPA: hypothetical protein VNZ45_16525, partial [Bacteroidia bacterium]|nr:hypothetical protein [Bacteroidia bacterium]